MNTEYPTAFRAAPTLFFILNEMPHAEFSNVFEIADHAHSILGSIPLIQMLQPDTGEAVTTDAVLDFSIHYLLTVLDFAYDASFRFEAVVTSATGACPSQTRSWIKGKAL